MKVNVVQGDITTFVGDAIVNAANPALLGGGGVDGAIHRAAGPELRQECERIPEHSPDVRCFVGDVVTTKGYNLPAKHVIHTVGPIFHRKVGPMRPGERNPTQVSPETLLRHTFIACLEEAERLGLKTVALPAISCGVYGCPIETGAEMAAQAIKFRQTWNLDSVTFVLFTDLEYAVFQETFEGHSLI